MLPTNSKGVSTRAFSSLTVRVRRWWLKRTSVRTEATSIARRLLRPSRFRCRSRSTDHQRIEADRAVVDEDAAVHLGDVDAALACRAAISFAASSKSAGMPRSRAKWLSVPSGRMPSLVSRSDERRGCRADRPVAAADDQQRVAALGDRSRADRAIAAVRQLDLDVEARRRERFFDPSGELRVGGKRAAAAVEENGNSHRSCHDAGASALRSRIPFRLGLASGVHSPTRCASTASSSTSRPCGPPAMFIWTWVA